VKTEALELNYKKKQLKLMINKLENSVDEINLKLDEILTEEELLHSVNESQHTSTTESGMFLNDEQLHKLLCLMDNSVIYKDGIENECDRIKLYDFRDELSYDIAEHFGYDLGEGSINTTNYTYYSYDIGHNND
jgi:hypothetical protein